MVETKPNNHNLLFWQPKTPYLQKILALEYGNMLMVLLNYQIWFFLLFMVFLLITKTPNSFLPIVICTIIGEYVEKFGKKHGPWKRPILAHHQEPPPGLVTRWYKSGSFPSGHTIKATFFFLFIIQYHVIHPLVYLVATVPLLIFRVFVGFHYPIDMIGGVFFGFLLWYFSHGIISPEVLNTFITSAYNFIFY